MTALTALKFNTEDGADQALNLVQNLAKQNLITVEDAAIVTWPRGKKKPKTKQHKQSRKGETNNDAWQTRRTA